MYVILYTVIIDNGLCIPICNRGHRGLNSIDYEKNDTTNEPFYILTPFQVKGGNFYSIHFEREGCIL